MPLEQKPRNSSRLKLKGRARAAQESQSAVRHRCPPQRLEGARQALVVAGLLQFQVMHGLCLLTPPSPPVPPSPDVSFSIAHRRTVCADDPILRRLSLAMVKPEVDEVRDVLYQRRATRAGGSARY
eukprot:3069006-Prymnesium_polylepis.1